MVMLLSFFVYTLTAVALFALARNATHRENNLLRLEGHGIGFCSMELILSICLFAFIAGARYKTGVDHITYLEEYLRIQELGEPSRETFEGGFLLISKWFAGAGFHFFFYFFFWAAIQIGFVYYALRDKKFLLPYVGLCIMLGPYFLSWMNGIRQCVVACVFVFLVEFIDKRKFFHYAVALILLSFIHRSAVLLLPLYFVLRIDFGALLMRRKLLLCLLLLCALIGSAPTWLSIVGAAEGVLKLLGYDTYAANIEVMATENLREMAWGPGRLSIFVCGAMIIWYCPSMREYFRNDNRMGMYFVLFLFGTYLYNLFANTSHIFLRPIEYLTIFRLPLTAYLLCFLWKKSKKVPFFVLLFLSCSNAYISILKAVIRPTVMSEYSLYKFFWTSFNWYL